MTSRTHTPEDIKKIDDEFKEVLSTRLFKEKKEWVGLTDEEMMQCYDDINWDSDQDVWLDFGENVQAKLKEKNT
jgi:hypothetical protein